MMLAIPSAEVNVFRACPVAMSSTTRERPTFPVPTPPPKIATHRSRVVDPSVTLTFPMNGSDQVSPTFALSVYSHSTLG